MQMQNDCEKKSVAENKRKTVLYSYTSMPMKIHLLLVTSRISAH